MHLIIRGSIKYWGRGLTPPGLNILLRQIMPLGAAKNDTKHVP